MQRRGSEKTKLVWYARLKSATAYWPTQNAPLSKRTVDLLSDTAELAPARLRLHFTFEHGPPWHRRHDHPG